MNQVSRIFCTLAAVIFSTGVIGSHSSGSIYPFLPVGSVLASVAILGAVYKAEERADYLTIGFLIVFLSVLLRAYYFTFPASLLDFDPDAFAVRIQVTLESGVIGQSSEGFYSVALIYQVFVASFGLIAGLPADQALFAALLSVAVGFPIIGIVWGRSIALENPNTAALVAATILMVSFAGVRFASSLRPQSIGTVLWPLALLCLILYIDRQNKSFLAIGLLLWSVLLFTHKLQPLLLFMTVCLFVGYYLILSRLSLNPPSYSSTNKSRAYAFGHIVSAGGTLMFIQWSYFYLLPNVTRRITALLTFKTRSVGASSFQPTAGDPVTLTLVEGIFVLSGAVTLLGLSGLCWVYLVTERKHSPPLIGLLSAGAVTGVFVTATFILPGVGGIKRVMLDAEPVLAVIVGVGITAGINQLRRQNTSLNRPVILLLVGAVAIVLLSQAATIHWSADYENSPRFYLTEGEAQAKMFTHDRVPEMVHMDHYYADEVVNFPRAARGDARYQSGIPMNPNSLNQELWNATLVSSSPEYVALRENIDVYRLDTGYIRLNWDPVAWKSSHSNMVYNNGDVRIFENTN